MKLRPSALALTPVLALSLSACGSSFAESTAEEIVTAAGGAMTSLESLRIQGSVTEDGNAFAFDIRAATNGDCTGTVELGEGDELVTIEVLRVDGEGFLKPDAAFLEFFAPPGSDTAAAAELFYPDDSGDFAEICDLDELLGEFEEPDGDVTTENEVADVDGQETVLISNSGDPDDEDSSPSIAYVSTDEPHYILKLEPQDEEGEVLFSEFDEELEVERPADDEIGDPGLLGG